LMGFDGSLLENRVKGVPKRNVRVL